MWGVMPLAKPCAGCVSPRESGWYLPRSSLSQRGPRPCRTASCSLKASVWEYTGPARALTGAWVTKEPASFGRMSLQNRLLRKSPHLPPRVRKTCRNSPGSGDCTLPRQHRAKERLVIQFLLEKKKKIELLLLIPCPWFVILTVMNLEVSAPKAWLLLSINTDYMGNNSKESWVG